MTHPFAARVAALLNLTGRPKPTVAPAPEPGRITLATLNQARKTLPHPATPAYRLRPPMGPAAGRPAWPFRIDASGSTTPRANGPAGPGGRDR